MRKNIIGFLGASIICLNPQLSAVKFLGTEIDEEKLVSCYELQMKKDLDCTVGYYEKECVISVVKKGAENDFFRKKFFGFVKNIECEEDLANRILSMFRSAVIQQWNGKMDTNFKKIINFENVGVSFAPIYKTKNNNPQLIEEINLRNNLVTVIDISLFYLTNLTKLNLSINYLTEIPKEINKLRKLEVLNVSRNYLTELPDSITKLDNLISLTISHNQITALPKGMGQMKKLKEIFASNNKIQSLDIDAFETVNILDLKQVEIEKRSFVPLELLNLNNNPVDSKFILGLLNEKMIQWRESNNKGDFKISLQGVVFEKQLYDAINKRTKEAEASLNTSLNTTKKVPLEVGVTGMKQK